MYTKKVFLTLDHHLPNRWQIKVDASHLRNEREAEWGYLFEYFPVDQYTGDSTIEIRNNPVKSTNKTLDIYASGPFQAFGREHRAAFGMSFNDYKSSLHLNSANPDGWDRRPLNFYNLQNFERPLYFYDINSTSMKTKEKALYGSVRLKLADPVAVILGTRATWYKDDTLDYYGPTATWTTTTIKESGFITPYAGVVFDLTKEFSAYASYTKIFQPTSSRDANNLALPAKTGENYEIGLKGEHFDRKLNTGFSVFRTQEKNLAIEDTGSLPLPDGSTPYRLVKGAQSKGFEFTVSGELARGLQLMSGYTYFAKRDNEGVVLQSNLPHRLLRLSTSYRLPGDWNKLTIGGSFSYQSGIYYDEVNGLGRASQGGVTVSGFMARYTFNKQLSASLNIENLTDKRYYSGLGGYNGYNYGTPRNAWVKLAYKF